MSEAVSGEPGGSALLSVPAALLDLLRCPESGQRLAPAPQAVVQALEARRRAGTLRLLAAEPQIDLGEPIAAGLIREDGRVFYAIYHGIPVLLPDHGMGL
jgi:uncharacterized protein YbaR (Trm112 family)